MLIAIVLTVAVILVWMRLFAPATPPKNGGDGKDTPAQAAPGNPPPAVPVPGNGGAPAPAPAPPKPALRQHAPHEEFVVAVPGSEWRDVGFTTTGGAIRFLRLAHDYERSERDEPKRQNLDLLLPAYAAWLSGDVSLDEADTEGMRTTDWTREPSGPEEVALSFLTSNGLKVTKRFALPKGEDRYDLDFSLSVERLEGAPAGPDVLPVRLLGVSGFGPEPAVNTSMDSPNQVAWWVEGRHSSPEYEAWGFRRTEFSTVEYETRAFRMVGVQSHYFAGLLWSEGGPKAPRVKAVWADAGDLKKPDWDASQAALKEYFANERKRSLTTDAQLAQRVDSASKRVQRAWVEVDVPVAAAGKAPEPALFHLYVGPLSRKVFAQDRYEPIHDLIEYPFAPDFIARFLLWILDIFKAVFSSAGVAIILMTLFVRACLMPVSMRSQLSMRRQGRKMAKIKPKLEALKARWSKDPKRFREEQVKLYREHGIGFPLGCIMLMLQMPIFFALFASLRIEYTLRHQPFLWMHDLAGPDALVDFGHDLLGWGFPPGGIHGINLLPLLYMGLSIWQQRLMPKPLDEQQAQQMRTAKWMTIIFPILLYNYTGALALYMVVSTSIAIIENRIVRTIDDRETAAHAA